MTTGNKRPPTPQAQHLVNLATQLGATHEIHAAATDDTNPGGYPSTQSREEKLRAAVRLFKPKTADSNSHFYALVKTWERSDLEITLCELIRAGAKPEKGQRKRRPRINTVKQAVRMIGRVTTQILEGEIDPDRGRASIYALQTVLVALRMLGSGEVLPQLNASAGEATISTSGNTLPLPQVLVIGEGGIVEEDDVIIEIIGKRLLAPVDWQAFCEGCNRETPHHAEHDCDLGLIRRCTICRRQTIAPWTRTTPAA